MYCSSTINLDYTETFFNISVVYFNSLTCNRALKCGNFPMLGYTVDLSDTAK